MNQSLEEILKEFKLAGERYNLPAKVVLMLSGSVHRAFEAGQKSTAREICICAAVKADDRTIVRCHRHSDGLLKLRDMGKTAKHEWAVQGFITSENRFVDRIEGLRLQLDAGIKSADPTGKYHGDQLFSEDLY